MTAYTTILIDTELRDALKKLKVSNRESYNEIIRRLYNDNAKPKE